MQKSNQKEKAEDNPKRREAINSARVLIVRIDSAYELEGGVEKSSI